MNSYVSRVEQAVLLRERQPQLAERLRRRVGLAGDHEQRVARCPAPVASSSCRTASSPTAFGNDDVIVPSSARRAHSEVAALRLLLVDDAVDRAARVAARVRRRRRPRTVPPSATIFLNTPNDDSRNSSRTSWIGMPQRRSGLSEPYLAMASGYGIRGNGVVDLRADHGEDLAHQRLDDVEDRLRPRERHLHVDLRELRLPVGAQVLVAEALADLHVAVEARHHQDLLEELRRLRQREELAGVHAARHEIVARAFGRGLRQNRRLDLEEPVARRSSAGWRTSAGGAARCCSAARGRRRSR